MFELRMLLYENYPDLAQELFIDVKSLMEQYEMRAIRLISFWMKHKIKSQGKYVIVMKKSYLTQTILF